MGKRTVRAARLGMVACLCLIGVRAARSGDFLQAKTIFQTNMGYDPRIAIAVDAVVVHMHGVGDGPLRSAIQSWKDKGYDVGRMFFADSDAANAYWKGKFDGREHPDEVERTADGQVVLCAGIRPYMLPTEGWTRYLETLTKQAIDLGAGAVLPEEPLAHIHTGYEGAFAPIWEKRYGEPWKPESHSARARFMTGQLKSELYLGLEEHLARYTKAQSRLPFVVPIHSMYSNVSSHLVAPLGTSVSSELFDGYIGQVWTGPVNWALANYGSPDKSFFSSAYLLYDYFVELVTRQGMPATGPSAQKKLWLLIDPVEDDPRHTWAEFLRWYRECTVASVLFPGVSAFEVMPWPDRIFLPGHATGGATPAPEDFRIVVLSATQVLQDLPDDGAWEGTPAAAENVGVAISDSAMWQNERLPKLQKIYGMLMPLAQAGVPVSSCVVERAAEAGYLARFRTIVLSYEAWKPANERWHAAIDAWVRGGGSLVLLGAPETIEGEMWWMKAGQASPMHHLCRALDIDPARDADTQVGSGWVLRRTISPAAFAEPKAAEATYLPLIDAALRKAGVDDGLRTPGAFRMRRGAFVAACATRSAVRIDGRFVDVFDPQFAVRDGIVLAAGESGLYRDVTAVMSKGKPAVLHTTHRLMSSEANDRALTLMVRGPAETPAVVRVFPGGRTVGELTGSTAGGKPVTVETKVDGDTLRLKFPNEPDGVTIRLAWNE